MEMPQNVNLDQKTQYIVDDALTDLAKCERYSQSALPLQRLVYTKAFSRTAKESGLRATIDRLLPLVKKLAADKEYVIRQTLAEELGELAEMLGADKDGYRALEKDVIPCIEKLLIDDSVEVRGAAGKALVRIAQVMTEEHVGSIVLTMVLCLAHDESDEQRTTAVGILADLADILGPNLCQNFVALELKAFADDPVFRVRKAAAQSFASVCRVVGQDFAAEKLIPIYLKLGKDQIWGVRKGCVESLVGVSKSVSPHVRATVLVPIFERFAKDGSRWVRNGAYEVLGPFLHTLGSEAVTKQLLAYYTQIPHMSSSMVDPEVTFFCAFNFPAVVMTLGPQRFPELVETFNTLVKDSKFHVRRTLSHALHDIAKIVGTHNTEKYLLFAFDAFSRDSDEVSVGVIRNLAKFFAVLSPGRREEFLGHLLNIVKQAENNWRWRELLAQQLSLFAILFSPDITAQTIVPLTLKLIRDPVAAVREEATRYVGHLVNRLHPANEKAFNRLVQEITSFAISTMYKERQLYIRICEYMVSTVDKDVFDKQFMSYLEKLSADRVVNVRITMARFLGEKLMQHPVFGTRPDTKLMIERLRKDPVRDVNTLTVISVDKTAAEKRHEEEEKMAQDQRDLDEILGNIPLSPSPHIRSPSSTTQPAVPLHMPSTTETTPAPAPSSVEPAGSSLTSSPAGQSATAPAPALPVPVLTLPSELVPPTSPVTTALSPRTVIVYETNAHALENKSRVNAASEVMMEEKMPGSHALELVGNALPLASSAEAIMQQREPNGASFLSHAEELVAREHALEASAEQEMVGEVERQVSAALDPAAETKSQPSPTSTPAPPAATDSLLNHVELLPIDEQSSTLKLPDPTAVLAAAAQAREQPLVISTTSSSSVSDAAQSAVESQLPPPSSPGAVLRRRASLSKITVGADGAPAAAAPATAALPVLPPPSTTASAILPSSQASEAEEDDAFSRNVDAAGVKHEETPASLQRSRSGSFGTLNSVALARRGSFEGINSPIFIGSSSYLSHSSAASHSDSKSESSSSESTSEPSQSADTSSSSSSATATTTPQSPPAVSSDASLREPPPEPSPLSTSAASKKKKKKKSKAAKGKKASTADDDESEDVSASNGDLRLRDQ